MCRWLPFRSRDPEQEADAPERGDRDDEAEEHAERAVDRRVDRVGDARRRDDSVE